MSRSVDPAPARDSSVVSQQLSELGDAIRDAEQQRLDAQYHLDDAATPPEMKAYLQRTIEQLTANLGALNQRYLDLDVEMEDDDVQSRRPKLPGFGAPVISQSSGYWSRGRMPRFSRRSPFRSGYGSARYGRRSRLLSAPRSVTVRSRGRVPCSLPARPGSCTIAMREFVCNVQSSSTSGSFFLDNSKLYHCNARNSNLVPWLSLVSASYDMFRFRSICFHYEPACSTSTNGQVIMGYDADPADVAPASWKQLAAYRGSVHCAPWAPCQLSVAPSVLRGQRRYYCQPVYQTNADSRLANPCRFFIASEGVLEQNLVLGKLYVSYVCDFFQPEVPSGNLMTVQNAGVGCKIVGTQHAGAGNSFMHLGVASGDVPFSISSSGVCTFLIDYQGLVVATVAGTGINSAEVLVGEGSARPTLSKLKYEVGMTGEDVVSGTYIYKVSASAGDSFVAYAGFTTLTSWSLWFAPFDYGL